MAWMVVRYYRETATSPVETIVNIDKVLRLELSSVPVRHGPSPISGSLIYFTNGSQLQVIDSFEEIKEVLIRAQGK